jgi:hypothetical protein
LLLAAQAVVALAQHTQAVVVVVEAGLFKD